MHFFIDAALEWKIDKSISEALALILSFGLVDAKANPPISSHRSGCSCVNELHGQWQTKQKSRSSKFHSFVWCLLQVEVILKLIGSHSNLIGER